MMTIRRCYSCQKFHRLDAMHEAKVVFDAITPKTTENKKFEMIALCNDCFVYIKGEKKR